ncbi:MAG: glycosyltransferase family 2 protein [Candidatus Shapirobacteria bacterium]|nr:glycosyltransferase family 2 protein [Candidatus Shapirobacteria bacterium]
MFTKKIVVLVLGYNSLNLLDDCMISLSDQSYEDYEIWFADNNSNDGSVEYLNKNFPKIKTFQFKKNTGYAGGNNRLIKMAFDSGADFSLVLNADVKVDKNFILELVNSYSNSSKKEKIGLVQPLVMLYNEPEKINSMGNVIHYLGFGYCGGYKSKDIPKEDREIYSVSGTAMLIPKNYYEDVGLFDESFFMYNEDQDYSWRGLIMGYKHYLSVNSKIWHKYSFSKNKNKWYFSEKNRLSILIKNYETKTLIKLILIIIFNELAILIYSLFDGWFINKLRSYGTVFKNLGFLMRERNVVQSSREVSDIKIIKYFSSKLSFDEVKNPLINLFLNPIYSFYRWLFRF